MPELPLVGRHTHNYSLSWCP